MKKKDESSWEEILKTHLLLRAGIPIAVTLIYWLVIFNVVIKSNDLIVSLGVILMLGSIFSILSFVLIAIKKLFNFAEDSKDF